MSSCVYDALIIGGGFGGCYALHKLRELGLNAHLVEAGTALGGVWHWNKYPGARVDSDIPFYQFSNPEVWRDWNWSERFPGHHELRAYFQHVDKVLNLSKDVTFSCEIVDVSFDSTNRQWHLKARNAWSACCTYLICATGSSIKAHRPSFKNIDLYKGDLIHSASWPDSFEPSGKRIAIIGSGASGVQCVQELTKKASHLTAYIRTACLSVPMRQRELSDLEQDANKSMYRTIFNACRKTRNGLGYDYHPPGTVKGADPAERERLWEETWRRGGFSFQTSNYRDYIVDMESNNLVYDFWARKTRERIRNPAKAAILAPEKAPFAFGTKRSSLEQDYYECLDQDHVDVVDLKSNPIKEFTTSGIICEDGKERDFDAIILATGFDSMTGSMTSMGLKDKNGIDIKERWKDGVFTYLGMCVSGCPNMFMLYGPQAPTALTNGPVFLDIQTDFLRDLISLLRTQRVATIEPLPSAEQKWRQDIQDMNDKTLFPLTDSWYMGANIPGKKREQLNYIGGIPAYEEACRASLKDWEGWHVMYIDGEHEDSAKTGEV